MLSREHKIAYSSLFVTYHAVTREIDRELRLAGELPLDEYDVLLHLEIAPDHTLRMSELAERTIYSKSGLTRLVDRMEQKGWIRREVCALDRRAIHAKLTPKGLSQREKTWKMYEQLIEKYFTSSLTSVQATELSKILNPFANRILEHIGQALES